MPPLPPSCSTLPISTAEALLERDPEQLACDANLSPEHVKNLRLKVAMFSLEKYSIAKIPAAPFNTGKELSRILKSIRPLPSNGEQRGGQKLRFRRRIATGSFTFDSFLQGGLRFGEVVEIIGHSRCEKTELCLSISVAAAMQNFKVIYIHPSYNFSYESIFEIARCRVGSAVDIVDIISRIQVMSVNNFFDLFNTFEEIEKETNTAWYPYIIILDSVATFMSPIIGGYRNSKYLAFCGQSLISHVAAAMKRLAYQGTSVIVTNEVRLEQTRMDGSPYCNGFQPALGRSWGQVPSTRVSLA